MNCKQREKKINEVDIIEKLNGPIIKMISHATFGTEFFFLGFFFSFLMRHFLSPEHP